MKSITKINDSSVTTKEYFQNMSMGLIYVYEYDLSEFEEFKTGLMADYNLKDMFNKHFGLNLATKYLNQLF